MLTAAQHRTFEFIKVFMATHGYAPTTGEIATGIGIKSRGVVHRYVSAIAHEGLVTLIPHRRRNIKLNKIAMDSPGLPVMGRIAAGSPIEAVLDPETLDIPALLQGPNRFALRVRGDSMIDEGIFDNDIVVCERSDTAVDGQIVVALIDEREATLKRLRSGPNQSISLMPANEAHTPQVYRAHRVKIQGIFIGLLRLGS